MYINSINNNYNNNFKSRNAEIRFADDIARKVNQEFPRISSSKILGFKNNNQYPDLSGRVMNKVAIMRYKSYKAFTRAHTFSKKLLATTSPIKTCQVGNCSESTELAEIAVRVNGINDCYGVAVEGDCGKEYKYNFDHAVLLVKNNGKPYIIDSWLGFADYIPEAIKRYQKDFRMHFDFNRCINEKMLFENRLILISNTKEIFAKNYSVEKLRKLYPELVLNKSASKKLTFWQRFKSFFNY